MNIILGFVLVACYIMVSVKVIMKYINMKKKKEEITVPDIIMGWFLWVISPVVVLISLITWIFGKNN